MHSVTSLTAKHEAAIAGGAETVLTQVGKGAEAVGSAAHAGAQFAGEAALQAAPGAKAAIARALAGDDTASPARRRAAAGAGMLVGGLLQAVGHATKITGKATNLTVGLAGTGVRKASPAVSAAFAGALKGASAFVGNASDALLLTEAEIQALRERLRVRGVEALQRDLVIQDAVRRKDRRALVDLLMVGGVSLAEVLRDPSKVPPEVEAAFQAAYPGLAAAGETFSEAVSRMSAEELPGLVAGVKGKLFELELVEHLNSGVLPAGQHAELATSATQPGWDLRIVDENGATVEVLQAKATESVEYVREALERYPEIEISTTSEVHAQLVAMQMADGVRDSGITEAALEAKVTAAASSGSFDVSDLMPSSLGLAAIALAAFVTTDGDMRQRFAQVGDRTGQSAGAVLVGNTAMLATQTWWVALIAGVGVRWAAGYGGKKRERYEDLRLAARGVDRVQQLLLAHS